MPIADHGDGAYIVDRQGKRYLDASGGAAVSCLGHSDPDVIRAIHQQVDKIAFAHTAYFTSDTAEELADLLVQDAPQGLEAVYFTSGGSEAVETALKMSRQYFLEAGEPHRTRFIARQQSYHGNTLGALSVGGHVARRQPYLPLLNDVAHISPCYAYRHQRPDETEEAYGLRAADELEARLSELPKDQDIVAYCRGAYCVLAIEAVEMLNLRGFHAMRLEEGMADWRARGLPVAAGERAN